MKKKLHTLSTVLTTNIVFSTYPQTIQYIYVQLLVNFELASLLYHLLYVVSFHQSLGYQRFFHTHG